MIYLIQPRELFGPPERQAELLECWRLNDGVFDEVTAPKGRPTFNELFALCKSDAINVIANSDIYFTELPPHPVCGEAWALSRWDVDAEGRVKLWDHADSQDAWVFHGKPTGIDAPFPMGVPGVDNRLVYELRKAGFNVTNPSKTIKTYHLHLSQFRSYLAEDIGKGRGGAKTMRVGPPYGFCPPTEL